MSSSNDSTGKTIVVAILLCLVCSVFVSSAAVLLKPAQEAQKQLDKRTNILAAAGIATEGQDVEQLFGQFTIKVVDLETGKYTDAVDPTNYDQRAASKDPTLSEELADDVDIASINRRARYAPVYLLEDKGKVDKVVIPVHGYGLWSTLYGFLALEGDGKTVVGLGFYEQGETPGLGGEVDNPKWKALWTGKEVFDDQGNPDIQLVKGGVNPQSSQAIHQVDALSGASLTSRGVQNLLQFWLGENGFGSYLANLRSGEV